MSEGLRSTNKESSEMGLNGTSGQVSKRLRRTMIRRKRRRREVVESGFKGVDAINKRGEDDIGLVVMVIEVLLKAILFWSILVMYFCLMWEVV